MRNTPSRVLGMLFAAVILAAPAASFAATFFDAAPEMMLKQAAAVRQQLNLTANQALLWFQAEAKTREMLRERQARRERLLAELGAALNTSAELRQLAKKLAAEEDLALQETRANREVWLGIDDALDERQRLSFHAAIREQMNQADPAAEARPEASRPAGDADKGRGGRRGHGGGMGSGSMEIGVGSAGGMSRF